MNHPPLVSIVTPSYNQGQFLEETILSVLNQDYPNLEYILIDGGSTDGSVDIIRKYEDRLAYWVSEPDAGQSDAINKGWRRSTGEIVAFLNSDDTYEPSAVTTAVQTLTEHPQVYLVYGDLNFIGPKGSFLYRDHPPDFDLRTFIGGRDYIPQPTTFFRRVVLDKVGMLDLGYQYAMDYEFFIRICSRFPVLYIPCVMANFRIHDAQKAIAGRDSEKMATLKILEEVGRDTGFTMEVRALAWRRIGRYYYEKRDMKLARRSFIQAFRTHWQFLLNKEGLYLFSKSLLGGRIVEKASKMRRKLSRSI